MGPKNARLLAAAGYADMQAVERFFLEVCARDQHQFLKHLKVIFTSYDRKMLNPGQVTGPIFQAVTSDILHTSHGAGLSNLTARLP